MLCGDEGDAREVHLAFCSDLMSDVLTLDRSDVLLITGLVNTQVIRTAEMADIRHILFVRDKMIPVELVDLATRNGMSLIKSQFSMFRSAGILFQQGIKPVF